MLEETGTVVAIEPDALWVETVQRTTCGSCSARSGCGQRVLGEALSRSSRLRILLNDRSADEFQLNQCVTIGIPENVVVLGSLGVYLVPLVAMVMAVVLAGAASLSEGFVALAGIAGLVVGGLLVRWYSQRIRNNPALQPVLL